jgi:hypothetical protein
VTKVLSLACLSHIKVIIIWCHITHLLFSYSSIFIIIIIIICIWSLAAVAKEDCHNHHHSLSEDEAHKEETIKGYDGKEGKVDCGNYGCNSCSRGIPSAWSPSPLQTQTLVHHALFYLQRR